MNCRALVFADFYDRKGIPPEYFVTHVCPAALRRRVENYLYGERPDLPRLHEAVDVPRIFLDVHGSVFHAERKVRVRLRRDYTVECYLSQAHAVCSVLREGDYVTVRDGRGLPFAIVPGMFGASVVYLDDVRYIADAISRRAAEGAALYEGTRSAAIAEGLLHDGRGPITPAPSGEA